MKISSLIKRFILINAFVAAIAGCGSGSSGLAGNTNTATPTGGTGSIAAKLVWNGSGSAKSTGKTLYAAPSGVNIIKVLVYDGFTLIKFQDFDAGLGTGTINAIPIGAGYKVKIWGLVSGTLVYEGIVENVTVEMNKTTNLGTIVMASITKASPDFGNYTAPQYVTLTASTAGATIYYTTNGTDPIVDSSPSGFTPLQNILIFGKTIIKFFSVNTLNATEPVKFGKYSTGIR